jgi:DNA repair protein RecO (recombination protein O)
MASFLGFLPENMKDIFVELHQQKAISMLPESFTQEANVLQTLANTPYQANFSLKSSLRRELVDYMLLFYRLNLDNFGNIKSLGILREVLK